MMRHAIARPWAMPALSPCFPETPIMSSESGRYTVSQRFDLPSSNITLQSSDRVLFKIHRINLEMYSRVFADAAATTAGAASDEIVMLSESSAVLEIMFQYMYLQPQPDLSSVEFEVLKELAEAVEKYEVYCAMSVCSHQMREHISEYPVDVMLYAIRHKYTDIMNESAVATLDIAPYSILSRVPHNVFEAWINYVETYQTLVAKEFNRFGPTRLHRGVTVPCDVCFTNGAGLVISSQLAYPIRPLDTAGGRKTLWQIDFLYLHYSLLSLRRGKR
ncbi:hypothetical protein E1B28_010701 [Marasmius oreades]|uniref:BTB domain-containing protein n=1 Tax=Marasmius oreades TaxID=181124 RepID=A0A9P7URE4_9AGAR|nr:uncharacterized protein E1B28_010701 [Marasmius oreades]KAG7091682.1 hypothetical protein E1B28_010701 [Marasmius oreades]